jgi:hypothetical protein
MRVDKPDISPDYGGFWTSKFTVKLSGNIFLEI